jgi:anti-anti-sigma factor
LHAQVCHREGKRFIDRVCASLPTGTAGEERGRVKTPDAQPVLPEHPPEDGPGANRRLDAHTEHLTTGVLLVRARGPIDKTTAFGFERQLIDAMRRSPAKPVRIRLDLGQVTFLDRAGLNVLLRVQARLEGTDGELRLLRPTPSVVRLLHQAHLDGASWMWPSD